LNSWSITSPPELWLALCCRRIELRTAWAGDYIEPASDTLAWFRFSPAGISSFVVLPLPRRSGQCCKNHKCTIPWRFVDIFFTDSLL